MKLEKVNVDESGRGIWLGCSLEGWTPPDLLQPHKDQFRSICHQMPAVKSIPRARDQLAIIREQISATQDALRLVVGRQQGILDTAGLDDAKSAADRCAELDAEAAVLRDKLAALERQHSITARLAVEARNDAAIGIEEAERRRVSELRTELLARRSKLVTKFETSNTELLKELVQIDNAVRLLCLRDAGAAALAIGSYRLAHPSEVIQGDHA